MIYLNAKKMLRGLFAFTLLSLLALQACDDEQTKDDPTPSLEPGVEFNQPGTVTLTISTNWGVGFLQLIPTAYPTPGLDTVRVSEITYYLSHLTLTRKDGSKHLVPHHNLITYTPNQPFEFTLTNIPPGQYTQVEFTIGVDSVTNSTGLHEGDLDPSNGMYWSWATGYVFFRMTGRHAFDNKSFVFDIGGNANLMKSTFSLTKYAFRGSQLQLNLAMNAAKVFSGNQVYSFATDPQQIHNAGSPGIAKLMPNIEAAFELNSINMK